MKFLGYVDINPWHVILRRVVFLPLYIVGVSIAYVALLGAWGVAEGNRFWHNSR